MYNNRLTNNKNSLINTIPDDLKLQVKNLLAQNNFELHPDNKIYILSSQRYLSGNKNFYLDLLTNKNFISNDTKFFFP